MATETVSSAPLEEVEKEMMKKMEEEKVWPPAKESEESEAKTEEDNDSRRKILTEEEEDKVISAAVIPKDDPNVAAEQKPVELPPPTETAKVELPAPIVDKSTPEVAHETACVVAEPMADDKPVVVELPPKAIETVHVPVAETSVEKQDDIKSEAEKEGECTNVEETKTVQAAVVIEEKKEETPIAIEEEEEEEEEEESKPCVMATEEILEKIDKKQTPEINAHQVEEDTKETYEAKSEAPVDEKHVNSDPIGEATGVAEQNPIIDDTKEVTQGVMEPGKSETGVAQENSVVPCEEEKASDSVTLAENATSRDIELACDKEDDKEVVKGEDETTKKVDEKIEESVEAKLEEVKQVDEKIAQDKEEEEEKQVNEPVECIKDSEDTKTYDDVRKEDVPVKKQSFVKIMKQSLVKAKKAIIGKSPNPKELKADGDK